MQAAGEQLISANPPPVNEVSDDVADEYDTYISLGLKLFFP